MTVKLVAVLALVPSIAAADVDWSKGLVTADGIGIANRNAPTPAIAREPARRMADDDAKKKLAAQLPAIPMADGSTLGDHLQGDVGKRVAEAVERAITVSATPGTDGSWNVTLAVPLEALRLARTGAPRSQPAEGDFAPPIVIVEGVTAKPALGYSIGKWAAAAVWRKDVPAWAKDAPRVKATGSKPGVIEIPDGTPVGPPRKAATTNVAGPPPTTHGGPSTLYILLAR